MLGQKWIMIFATTISLGTRKTTMTQHNPPQRAARTDFRTRDVVNQAIAAIPTLGLQQVAEFLSAMNVPPEVAIRTLVYPDRRRN
jgi:hypothetical protein